MPPVPRNVPRPQWLKRLEVKTHVYTLGTAKRPTRPFDIDHFRVWSETQMAALKPHITAIDHEQTIEGASTVTVKISDPNRSVLRSSIVKQRSTVSIDYVDYALVKVSRAGDDLTLTFEELAVNYLRRYDQPRKAARDTVTRAQFVKSLVDEVKQAHIPFRCPELNVRQPVARS